MLNFSPIQIIIVLVIALLVFGPRRLPEMGRNLGRSMREFRSSSSGERLGPTPPAGWTETPRAAPTAIPAIAGSEDAAPDRAAAPAPDPAGVDAVDAETEWRAPTASAPGDRRGRRTTRARRATSVFDPSGRSGA